MQSDENVVDYAEIREVYENLYSFLNKITRQYTLDDSSSVKKEVAENMLLSVLFILRVDAENPSAGLSRLICKEINEEYNCGVKRIIKKVANARQKWMRLCVCLNKSASISLNETVKNIGSFFKSYDYYFAAHEIPCEIDYQLAVPLSEKLCGIDYINGYLDRLSAENEFMNCFDLSETEILLEKTIKNYKQQIVNLFEPCFINAVGKELAGSVVASICIKKADIESVSNRINNKSGVELEALFKASADSLFKKLGLHSLYLKAYFNSCAASLVPRVLSAQSYENIFMVIA